MISTLNRHFNENVNMQALQHQIDQKLFMSLLPVFEKHRALDEVSTSGDKEFTAEVERIVKSTLNMSIDFNIEEKYKAYMRIPQIDKNHPLINKSIRRGMDNRELRQRLKEDLGKVEASIDPTTGRLEGFLTGITVFIALGRSMLSKRSILTVEESVAVFLHELGHGWTFFYMLGGTLRTNVVIHAALHDYQFGKDPKADYKKLLVIEQATGSTISDKGKVASKGNDAVAISLINRQVQMQRSEYGTSGFDESGAEAIADQFVSRQGAGVHIVTGLDKLERYYSLPKVIAIIGDILAALSVIGLYGSPLLIAVFLTDPTTGSYDDPYKRAKRVREQIVSSLKEKGLTKEERRKRLHQLDTIDTVMDKVKDNEPLFDFIWRKVIEGGNAHVKNKLIQEGIESLINNDLYVLGSVLTVNKT